MGKQIVKRYRFCDIDIVERKFQNYFGVSFKPFYDGVVSVFFKCLILDILKFDDWLHSQFGQYEDTGKSMRDIVLEKYGEDAFRLIKSLIG